MLKPGFLTLVVYVFFQFIFNNCEWRSKKSEKQINIDTGTGATNDVKSSKLLVDTLATLNKQENKIIDSIFNLPEVKKRAVYVEKKSKGKRHLQIWIYEKPDSIKKYYWIKVGEDNGISLFTHFNFFVYPASMRIMYLDASSNKEITLGEWRAQKSR